jgi:hypothetical protein
MKTLQQLCVAGEALALPAGMHVLSQGENPRVSFKREKP